MKKIIAAALSVLVGAFGYTIVDKALESRVATLESEVAELRGYHSSEYEVTTGADFELKVGQKLYESSHSIHKFLVREYSDGTFSYIPYYSYSPVSLGKASKAVARSSLIVDDDWGITTTTAKETTIPATTSYYPVAEYYVNLTESSAVISGNQENISYYYDSDYSKQSTTNESYNVTIYYKGYTDPALAGRELKINSWIESGSYSDQTPFTVIKHDGSFEFEYTVAVDAFLYGYNFYINSISIR